MNKYMIIRSDNKSISPPMSKHEAIIKLKEYNKKVSNDIDSLIRIINKISTSKIIVIGNYCLNDEDYSSYYSKYNYINMNKLVSNNENISSFRTFKLSNEGNFTLYKYVKSIKNHE